MTKEEIEQSKIKSNNMKLFPLYETVGLDYIFYYGIEVLFLSQVKGISDSNIVLLSALYAIFLIIFQIPSCGILNRIGKRKSILYGNILKLISIIIMCIGKDFYWMLISQFIRASGFALTGISAKPLLAASIPDTNDKGDIFSKIYGKGYARYCYICAISTILSGCIYTINAYIPIYLCAASTFMAIIIAYNFIEIEDSNKQKIYTMKENFLNILEGFKEVIKSERLKALLLMIGTIWGLISLLSIYQTTLLKNMGISATYIGLIAAIVQIITVIFSKKANEYNDKNGNRSLTKISLSITLGAILIGIIAFSKLPICIMIILVSIIFGIRHQNKGYFQVLRYRYIGNFVSEDILTKVYASNLIMSNLMRALIEYLGSVILLYNNINIATLIIGIIFTIVCIFISIYMKKRVGIKNV